MRLIAYVSTLLLAASLIGCAPMGDGRKPIPNALVPASQPAKRLVVVLPGRGEDLPRMQRSGMAASIQAAWPDADVLLTGLTLDYYRRGNAEQRLHDEVIAPARARGIRQVWLLGISMGGMGALMYDRAHPGDVDGLVLLSPYVGEKPVLKEISDAGSVAAWQSGPVPAVVGQDNFSRELWRHVQSWQASPAAAPPVWLAYGDRDKLKDGDALLASTLPTDRVRVLPGGHDWDVWLPAATQVLRAVDAQAGAPSVR